ncbi:MAG: AMP-binding protein [Desulfobulbaceae bacterium]|nr:AMP-binding protein [Desulfobulbaceae bacterium]HIJ90020.1 AMP-binding protein [Deltaproteobacteria bacterium]
MNPPPSQPSPDFSSDGEQLLSIVRKLARELKPNANTMEHLGLNHGLERDFGLDSLTRVELLVRIERDMGVRLAETALAEAETPGDLLRLMRGTLLGETPARPHISPQTPSEIHHPPETIATLTEMLDWHVAQHGERTHITLYVEEERTEEITYRMLQAEARTLAAGLLAQGVTAGERIAIMLPTGRDFFSVFYGTIYAGCVPVPLYPPARPSQLEDHMRRIAGIVVNAEAAMLITDERAKPLGHLLRAQCPALRSVKTVAELACPGGTPPPLPRPNAQDIAFLQYTSGSTGNPKGVVLTHANLLANLRAMEQASGITSTDIFVSWLPLYHDMGLIGACMGSLSFGFRLVLMSPLAFLARPSRWLWTIHRHRATVSAAPNFAYELCANKLKDRDLDGLDLSCWRLAYNGAESVSPETLTHFATRFAPKGFRPEAMTPVYGLAESSLGLAFPPLKRGPLVDRIDRDALFATGIARIATAEDSSPHRIVSCGLPLSGHSIRIVDANGREMPERTQGRVQFQGPSATRGYFRNPEATHRLFDGAWLNTGDLGYLAAGELYLTGREKDIIIRGGHNIHPQELEEAVNQVPGIRKGGVAVFPATDSHTGSERLVVLAETRAHSMIEERSRIRDAINHLTIDLLGLPADDIVLAPPRTVLKTSSGKIRRAACRERYERGELSRTQQPPWLQLTRLTCSGTAAHVRHWLKRGIGWVWSAWAWAVFAVITPFAWLLIILAPTLKLRRLMAKASARLSLAMTGLMPRVEGLQHLAENTPVIVVCNHASYLDALILTAMLPARFTYVTKQELLGKPFAGIPLRRLDSAFVERFDSARGVEDTCGLEERARIGASLLFFAEGTFRTLPGLLSFRMGAFIVAARCSLPVVPVTLIGTRTLLRDETWRPHYCKLQMLIDKPVSPEGDNDWQKALKLRDTVRGRILERLEEPDSTC